MEIRDPIHGFIHNSAMTQAIIDTHIFQRLRRIKQLAMAFLVYPGALHTRFEHSLGVMHIAGQLHDRLVNDPDEAELVRAAALLHDIGHGPFSHVSECVFEQLAAPGGVDGKGSRHGHETLTRELIRSDPELAGILGDDKRQRIIGLLEGTWGGQIRQGILSGPLDADKLDYLLRDSYYCGVKYGVYDFDRLLHTVKTLGSAQDPGAFLAVSEDGVHSLEQFVLAKYYMTEQVYRHRVRLITDNMIVRGILLGIQEDKLDVLTNLYCRDGSAEHLTHWVAWDDEKLTQAVLCGPSNSLAREMFLRLRHRQLYKRVFRSNLLAFNSHARVALSDRSAFRSMQHELEHRLAEVLGIMPHAVIAYVYQESRNPEASVVVDRQAAGTALFEELSKLFVSIEDQQWLDVYAPVDFRDASERERAMKKWAEEIPGVVESMITASGKEG